MLHSMGESLQQICQIFIAGLWFINVLKLETELPPLKKYSNE